MIGFPSRCCFLKMGKMVRLAWLGFFPSNTSLNQKTPNLKQVGIVCLGFMKSPFLSEVHGKSQIAGDNRVNINTVKEKLSPKPSVIFLSP